MKVSKRIGEPVDVVREAVVGDHRRDRGEKTHRGGDQRLGDARRHLRERRLRTFARPRNAFMMPHTVPKRPTYGLTEPTEARKDRCDSSASISRW